MESPPPPPVEADVASAANPNSGDSEMSVENHARANSSSNVIVFKKKLKNKKKRKDVQKSHIDVSSDPAQRSLNSSSSSSSTPSNLLPPRSKGIRLSGSRRNPRVSSGPIAQRRSGNEADALALPLGMSIAAFVAQVLERKDASGEKMSVDHLSEICTLAVKESLSNVFGSKFDCFVSNFERSFQSTLMTLRVINESSGIRKKSYLHGEGSSNNFYFDMKDNTSMSREQKATVDIDEENVPRDPVYNELAVLHDPRNGQQLTCISPSQMYFGNNHNQSMLSTFEKSVTEQARLNDLKALEISLSMKKMRLKEAQIAVDCDSNILERVKLSMGFSKANFKAEKYKNEVEESRNAEFLRNCADYLVAGLVIMVVCLFYGIYVYSPERLFEATKACTPIEKSSSWSILRPMASVSSGIQTLQCKVQVISQMLFGILMIIAITFLLIRRSGTTNQAMPVTFILLLLGVGCGFAGKFCIDTLGGSGNHWLIYWEVLCLVHLFANICTSMLFVTLHGPVKVTDQSMRRTLLRYRFRRFVFYSAVLVCLPLLCGLMPFAGPGEWLKHFISLVVNRVPKD